METNIKGERQVAARLLEKMIGIQRKAQPYGCAFLLCVCSWGEVELHHKTRNRPLFYGFRFLLLCFQKITDFYIVICAGVQLVRLIVITQAVTGGLDNDPVGIF